MNASAPGTLAPAGVASDNALEVSHAKAPPAAINACLRAIERVEQIVEQETSALQRHERGGLADFNHRKSHGLLELTRAIRALGGPAARQVLEPRLQALSARLQENSGVLKMHLDAVREVSAVMARAIRDGESDGTYSAAIRFPGDKR